MDLYRFFYSQMETSLSSPHGRMDKVGQKFVLRSETDVASGSGKYLYTATRFELSFAVPSRFFFLVKNLF